MSDLTDFLLARIAGDEEADAGLPHAEMCRQFGGWPGDPSSYVECDCGVHDRVLAECEAKRQVIAQYVFTTEPNGLLDRMTFPTAGAALEIVLGAFASVYADHPDYREEWRP